jgi:hypothetical protein
VPNFTSANNPASITFLKISLRIVAPPVGDWRKHFREGRVLTSRLTVRRLFGGHCRPPVAANAKGGVGNPLIQKYL